MTWNASQYTSSIVEENVLIIVIIVYSNFYTAVYAMLLYLSCIHTLYLGPIHLAPNGILGNTYPATK